MTKIIHNARCSKSRNCFQILEEKGESFEVREYLKKPLDKEELRGILKKLNLPAEKIIRKTEAEYKENFKDKIMSEEDWIEAMIQYPKLIQRPILIRGDKAIIARSEEAIEAFYNE
ncbi:MAG TPA: arsenate reductase (glutaredoxin) [Chitinophagaceae bacterium]|nr:arsenate reductase (glutaredoxin) [Chitinophagaceae bacterium]